MTTDNLTNVSTTKDISSLNDIMNNTTVSTSSITSMAYPSSTSSIGPGDTWIGNGQVWTTPNTITHNTWDTLSNSSSIELKEDTVIKCSDREIKLKDLIDTYDNYKKIVDAYSDLVLQFGLLKKQMENLAKKS